MQILRLIGVVAGAACMLMGALWFLQGMNILPGSFMTGQTRWAIYGGLIFVGGAALIWQSRRGA